MRDYYLYDYDAIFRDGIVNINNEKFKFKEIGLKNMITCVAALKLTHTMAVKQTQDYLGLVKRISKNTSPFLFCSRAYVGLYLDKILNKDHGIQLFKNLLNKIYESNTFLMDYELNDFISDSIVDYINYDGELHYPSFLLENLSNHFFKSIKEGDLETFFLNLKLGKNDLIHDKIFLLMKDEYTFNFIDPDAYRFVLRIFPFKTSTKPEYLIRKTTLLLKNKIVKELFYERIKIEKDKVICVDDSTKETFKPEDEKKINEIIKKLNNSLIFHLTESKRNGTPSNESIDITLNHKTNCDCSKCKFNNLKLDDVIKELYSYSINETSDLKEDIQKAYLNYKYGNYLQSFKMYEEIASKSWQIGKYIS